MVRPFRFVLLLLLHGMGCFVSRMTLPPPGRPHRRRSCCHSLLQIVLDGWFLAFPRLVVVVVAVVVVDHHHCLRHPAPQPVGVAQ